MVFSELSTRQKHYLLFAGVYGIASVLLFVVVRLGGIPSSVYDGYFPYADAMMSGTVPYTDQVFVYGKWSVWEYPPLAYVVLFIPRLFASNPAAYEAVFIVMTFVVFLIGLYFSERMADNLGYSSFKVMLLYTVAMMLMFEFQVDRFDIIPAVITLVALSMMIEKRYEWAFVLLAVGTLMKLYPAILMPVLLIYLLSIREYKHAGISVMAAVISAAIVLGALLAIGSHPLAFLDYHTERPLEIESLAASIISFLGLFMNLEISTVFSFGSDNIVGPLPDSIASVLLWIMMGLILVVYVVYAYFAFSKKTENLRESSIAMLMTLLVFMLFSTVFSGQYMIWAIPAMAFCLLLLKNKSDSKLILVLFIVAEVLTQLNFFLNFGLRGEGMDMSTIGIVTVLIRNIVLLYLLYVLGCLLAEKRPLVPKKLSEHLGAEAPE